MHTQPSRYPDAAFESATLDTAAGPDRCLPGTMRQWNCRVAGSRGLATLAILLDRSSFSPRPETAQPYSPLPGCAFQDWAKQ